MAAAGGVGARVGALPDSLLVTGSSFNTRRARLMNKPTRGETPVHLKGPVLYWMSRDQRVQGITVETQPSRIMLLRVTLFATPINAPQAHE